MAMQLLTVESTFSRNVGRAEIVYCHPSLLIRPPWSATANRGPSSKRSPKGEMAEPIPPILRRVGAIRCAIAPYEVSRRLVGGDLPDLRRERVFGRLEIE